MTRMALGVAYHGTAYHGWQTQYGLPNIQDCIEQALYQFTRHTIRITCAGRTDAGVHALNQVIHFDTPVERSHYAWVKGVNTFLPADIRIVWAQSVADEFHARFDAQARSYIYYLCNEPIRSPMWLHRAGWAFRPLRLEWMQAGAQYLLGEHDFSCFRASDCQAKSPVKHCYQADIEQQGSFFIFRFQANAFLHHMVRNILGSLLYVGQGKHPPEWIAQLIQSRQRQQAAPTFMPDGLYLSDVHYADWNAASRNPLHLHF